MQVSKAKKEPKTTTATMNIAGVNIPDIAGVMEKAEAPKDSVRVQRLKELEYLMRNHDKIFPQKLKFDLRSWYRAPLGTRLHNVDLAQDCGTAACALGAAACYKPFIDQGLRISQAVGDIDAEDVIMQLLRGDELVKYGSHTTSHPVYKGETGYAAGEEFFGITVSEGQDLFDPRHYDNADKATITANQVADRVATLVEKYSKIDNRG